MKNHGGARPCRCRRGCAALVVLWKVQRPKGRSVETNNIRTGWGTSAGKQLAARSGARARRDVRERMREQFPIVPVTESQPKCGPEKRQERVAIQANFSASSRST